MLIHVNHLQKKESLFFYLLLLTGFFLLLEISFFIQCNGAYLAIFNFVANRLRIPLTVLPGIIYFIFAQLLVHLTFCLFTWGVTILNTILFKVPDNKKTYVALGVWLLSIITILVANQYWYPNSKFAELTAVFLFNRNLTKIIFIILSLFSCSLLILSFISLLCILKSILKKKSGLIVKFSLGMLFFIGIIASYRWLLFTSEPTFYPQVATADKPNIILIGMDSLRPDFLSFFGGEQSTLFLDNFLAEATVFAEAITPDARTFPAWTSILTGQHPRETGIRFNLASQQTADFTQALPALLQREGYETMYASDETRFSNVDKNFGFDHIITPPVGLNDFLLGTFNDFPLSNLLINTPIGKWLFPHSYGNRPVYFTYEPKSFLNLIQSALIKRQRKPLFLAVHFCLPHAPYAWGKRAVQGLNIREQYEASIGEVDKQVKNFFSLLNQYQLLNHAIIVVLSDHGEALALPGDRITEKESFLSTTRRLPKLYPQNAEEEVINESVGHGTDVLGLPQYHSLLAFKLYGTHAQRIGVIPGVTSLIEIKPTLLALIKHSSHTTSLADIITGKQSTLQPRHVFIESDYSPDSIRTVYPETKKVLLDGIELFQIDPKTTRLTVKNTMAKMIVNSKQYADIYGEWMLALYPQSREVRMPILINLSTGEWTNDLSSTFAQQSPSVSMLEALKTFYGNEITNIS